MISFTKFDIFFYIILMIIGIGNLVLIIILFANRPEELQEIKTDDIAISYFSTLNFNEIDSFPAYSKSSSNLGLTGRIILDCYSGICQKERINYENNKPEIYYEDVLDYSCSYQCSYNVKQECDCSVDSYKSKGKCSRLYDDSYDIEKYCFADNVIYNWKGKKYSEIKKDILTYYKNAKLKEEECPIGTINCGIIDDNENKLCMPLSSNCPINYLSENKLNSNKIQSTLDIGNKTFYYTYDDEPIMKRKIIAGLVADTDLYLNRDNDKKVLIDTDTISGFLADNKNLYKGVLGYDPYKEENVDNKGNSYLRIFYNNKVDLQELRNNINTYNLNHKINEEGINPVRKKTKFIMIFGLISFISFLICMIVFVIKRDSDILKGIFNISILIFIVFYILSFVFVCINFSKFNKLNNLDENVGKVPRKINLTIFILYLLLLAFIIFLPIYIINLREKCKNCSCEICGREGEDIKTPQKVTEKITQTNSNQYDTTTEVNIP